MPTITSAMGVDRVDRFTPTLLDEPASLIPPVAAVEKNTSCFYEGFTELQPWAPNVPPFAHTRAGVPQGYSEASRSNFCVIHYFPYRLTVVGN